MQITALTGTVAIVTGATSGIGDATARRLAETAQPSPSSPAEKVVAHPWGGGSDTARGKSNPQTDFEGRPRGRPHHAIVDIKICPATAGLP